MHNFADLAVSANPHALARALAPFPLLPSLSERNGMAHSYAAEYLPISRLSSLDPGRAKGTKVQQRPLLRDALLHKQL